MVKKLFFLLCFFSGILFFLDKRGWLGPVRGLAEKPILAAEEKTYSLKIFFTGKSSEKELTRLQGELQRLAVGQNQLSSCLEENEKMKKLLGTPLPSNWKFLPVKVVGVNEQLKIKAGISEGIKEGMIVLSEAVLVGKVISAGSDYSLVDLPITPTVKIPVVVKRKGNSGIQAQGLVIGQYGGKLLLDRVLQGEDIQKGDLIVTSGEEGWLPDLVIGTAGEIFPKTAAVYQRAQVLPLMDYQKLRIVFVVIR